MTDTTPTLAELLRTTRQQRGYSREQLAMATKVPLAFIVAVEEEDDAALPDVVFGRGFVRILGNYLGLEVAPLLAAYDELHHNTATTARTTPLHVGLALERGTARKPQTGGRSWTLLVLVLVLLGGGVFYWLHSHSPEVSTSPSPAAEVESKPEPQAKVQVTATPTPVAAMPVQRLRLQVVRPLRIEVALDDAPRRGQMFLPQSYEFAFVRQAWLRISDTAAVKIWFNGEDLGDLQRGGQQRTLIFTADSLDTARAADNAGHQL